MTRLMRFLAIIVVALLFVTLTTHAQENNGSVTGVVTDSSGALLPGVTVEATSPALIEKVRTGTTDGQGRYQIVGLSTGTYTLTFTLSGFGSVKRENVPIQGGFTATIEAQLKVGAVEETVTVTGSAPLIDVTTSKRQAVMSNDVIEALPSSRVHSSLAQLVPGISTAEQDVGGTVVSAGLMAGHGTHGGDSRIMINGLSQGSTRNSGGGRTTPNVGAMEQMVVDYTGADASAPTGGISANMVPREGGNRLKGSSYLAWANSNWQANNLTRELEARGLPVQDAIKDNWDMNPSFGGPIKTDKLWFYTTFRNITANNYVGGMYVNKNAGDPTKWTYEPDLAKQAVAAKNWKDFQTRFTWQATRRNKFSFTVNDQRDCECWNATGTVSPEAASGSVNSVRHVLQFDYTLPLTNKILFEFNGFWRTDNWNTGNWSGVGATSPYGSLTPTIPLSVIQAHGSDVRYLSQAPYLNPISIQTTSLAYRNQTSFSDSHHVAVFYRGAMSYVTGSHNVKIGFNNDPASLRNGTNSFDPLAYRLSAPLEEGGKFNQVTLRATPYFPSVLVKRNMGLYAQDRWTTHRVTIGLGVRYDNFVGGYNEMNFGPAPLVPNRNLHYDAGTTNNWKDITPRSSLAWDVFGNGKTAIKVGISKYMDAAATNGIDGRLNPFSRLVNSVTRSWTDANNNFIPDCDLLNPIVQSPATTGSIDTCGAMSDAAFGTPRSGYSADPDLVSGWGKRDYNWEFSTGVQHEVLQGLVVDVGYFRRWYGNFTVQDNLALTPADFDSFSIVAPTDRPFAESAPEGATIPTAGQTIGGLYNVVNAKFSTPADNFETFSKNYGKQIEQWNGIDVAVLARFPFGLNIRGGTSTGRTITDNCEIRAKLPEIAPTNPWCRVNTGFLTDLTGFATYTIPKVDILTSVTFQNRPSRANPILANYTANNAAVSPSLGRNLSGQASNVTVPLYAPYSVLGDRFTQIDFRFGKVFRIGTTRTTLNFDIFNATNNNSILVQNNSFNVWQEPDEILLARFLKIGLQYDF